MTREEKDARAAAIRERYASDPEFRERCKANARRANAKSKDHKRRYDRAKRYGITIEEAEEMESITHCQATGLKLGEGKLVAVDHDHETGAVRGILAARINMAIGLCDDDPELLRAAADYLERTRRPGHNWRNHA